MGALHFLDDDFITPDPKRNTEHLVELFEQGGKLYLQIRIGRQVDDASTVTCQLTPEQARLLSEKADSLADRISL